MMDRRDDMTMLAGLVAAVGTPDFPARFLLSLRDLCGARLFSAFAPTGPGAPRALFAEGDCRAVPDFARSASQAYCGRFWRTDQAVRRAVPGRARGGVMVVRTRARDIADPDYRRTCYERGDIAERLSILSAGPRALVASGYRSSVDGEFQPADIERLEGAAPILMAALCRHVDLSANRPCDDTPETVADVLLAAGVGLSLREAEVAANMILGRTQAEIGAATGLTLSSIITYRRRAYCKLGVMDKQDLATTYGRLRPPTASR
ncbi:helix-turn-helix transcriptional regulator [Niveispirillum fermenti]|uniref:helix-turn-helix transcriptional regulator n=1 Tax=Niveispirillum fermenti TaxID=1233113 RepID=UPI003A8ACBDF